MTPAGGDCAARGAPPTVAEVAALEALWGISGASPWCAMRPGCLPVILHGVVEGPAVVWLRDGDRVEAPDVALWWPLGPRGAVPWSALATPRREAPP